MADFMLKVTPQQLKTKAGEIQNQISSFENSWKQITQIVSNSKGYWVGDASNAHQKAFQQCQDDVQHIIKRLKEHPQDLMQMAGVYEEHEKAAASLAAALPGDVIV